MQLNIGGEAADTVERLVRSGRHPSAEDGGDCTAKKVRQFPDEARTARTEEPL